MTSLTQSAIEYGIDTFQRSILFADIMRKRGNLFLEHVQAGQPPVLIFDYEIIMRGDSLDPPSNYQLSEIKPPKGAKIDPRLRPVVVVDPRAGHGPGIGGSKRDSEIGMALQAGHPVYFIMFEKDPVPGQTIDAVEQTEIAFIDEVVRRHPDAPKPAVIGNCQAGWALAMLAADRPGTTGPIVLNGSPLSYWAGEEGRDVLRYLGGLMGGVWVNDLLSDLGDGIFDGANLVLNFENMNPANTLWDKQYHVWKNVDTEEKRYLGFERWWNGFFNMTKEEIHFIVDNLFMDNRLEGGEVVLRDGKALNLKDITDPIVIFCSDGDAITPPQQALNWIVHVWDSVEEIRRNGQVIIYMIHPTIGHLGIFVSGKVAAREHREMLDSYEMMELLPPGLYEMVIENDDEDIDKKSDYLVRFEEREIEDILALDDNMTEEEENFPLVTAVGNRNDWLYDTFASPWVRSMVGPTQAQFSRLMHPLRVTRYGFSDLNPWLWPVAAMAPRVKEARKPASSDNPFSQWEGAVSNWISTGLENMRLASAHFTEAMFQNLYSPHSPLHYLFPEAIPARPTTQEILDKRLAERQRKSGDFKYWLGKMREGGFAAGLIRTVITIAAADHVLEREQYMRLIETGRTHEWLKDLTPEEFRTEMRRQSRIIQSNRALALETLPDLLPTEEACKAVLEACKYIFEHDNMYEKTKDMIDRIFALKGFQTAKEPEAEAEKTPKPARRTASKGRKTVTRATTAAPNRRTRRTVTAKARTNA